MGREIESLAYLKGATIIAVDNKVEGTTCERKKVVRVEDDVTCHLGGMGRGSEQWFPWEPNREGYCRDCG